MIRKAFVMGVDPKAHETYRQRHDPVWAEMIAMLKQHGVSNYSIFLDAERHTLFGYVEIEDEARWLSIAAEPVCRRWWRFMGDIMPCNPDGSPVQRPLVEVFHLD